MFILESAQLQTFGVRSDVKRFKKRQQADDFVQKVIILGQPPLPGGNSLYRWLCFQCVWLCWLGASRTAPSRHLVVMDRKAVDWIGAQRPTNNTGELSAFYHHAVQWILSSQTPETTAVEILTFSFTAGIALCGQPS